VRLFAGGLNGEERSLTGVEMIDDLDQAVASSVRASGEGALAVIPEGPYVVPVFRPAGASR
jgi:hypothetical protein